MPRRTLIQLYKDWRLWTQRRFNNSFIRKFTQKPLSRRLSIDEIALVRSVFGDSITLNNVQLKSAWWVLRGYAVSPNGNIYFHPEDWVVDFSSSTLGRQSWLIHELTHVWQLQQGLNVILGALLNRRYSYTLTTGKSFFKYGIEQQAQMVQDYFIRRARGQDCRALEDCIPFLNHIDLNRMVP